MHALFKTWFAVTDFPPVQGQRCDIRVALGQNKLTETGTTRSEKGFGTVCSPAKNHNVGRKAFEKLPFPGRARMQAESEQRCSVALCHNTQAQKD